MAQSTAGGGVATAFFDSCRQARLLHRRGAGREDQVVVAGVGHAPGGAGDASRGGHQSLRHARHILRRELVMEGDDGEGQPDGPLGVEHGRGDVRDGEALGLAQLEEEIVVDVVGASRLLAGGMADGDRVAAVAYHREGIEVALALGSGRPRADAGQPVPHPFAVRPREEDGADGRHQREPRADAHVDAERPWRGRVGEHDDLVVDDATGHAVEVELTAHCRHLDRALGGGRPDRGGSCWRAAGSPGRASRSCRRGG